LYTNYEQWRIEVGNFFRFLVNLESVVLVGNDKRAGGSDTAADSGNGGCTYHEAAASAMQ